jgi:hypothetical protein
MIFDLLKQKLLDGFIQTIKRFPLSILCFTVFTIFAIYYVYHDGDKSTLAGNILMTTSFGGFWFISIKLWIERMTNKSTLGYAVGAILFIFVGMFIFNSPQKAELSPFIFNGVFLLMYVAPYLGVKTSESEIWSFDYRISLRTLQTGLISAALFTGLAAIYASLRYLFGIKIDEKIFFSTWIIVACFFAPIYAMAGIPQKFDDTESHYPTFFRIIFGYVGIPLLIVYGIILYAYTAKILLQATLPKGNVSYMVTSFGTIGLFLWLSVYPLINASYKIPQFYLRHFFKFVLIPLALLAVAIVTRLNQYGITDDRYAIAACLIWLTFTALISFIKPQEQFIKKTLLALILILFISAFSPFNVINVSAWNQTQRLANALTKAQILVSGKINPSHPNVPTKDLENICSILRYLVQIKKTDSLKPWFADIKNNHVGHIPVDNQSAAQICVDMNIKYLEQYYANENSRCFNYNFESKNPHVTKLLNIQGYDFYVEIGSYMGNDSKIAEFKLPIQSEPEFLVSYDQSTQALKCQNKATGKVLLFDLKPVIEKIRTLNYSDTDKPTFTLNQENDEVSACVTITSLSGSIEDDKPTLSSLYFNLLLHPKTK